jgi:predicted site-specific integrase-resolvase
MQKIHWIKEEAASEMLGIHYKTLRRYAKSGKYAINYSRLSGRNYQYNKVDIENLLLENSTVKS